MAAAVRGGARDVRHEVRGQRAGAPGAARRRADRTVGRVRPDAARGPPHHAQRLAGRRDRAGGRRGRPEPAGRGAQQRRGRRPGRVVQRDDRTAAGDARGRAPQPRAAGARGARVRRVRRQGRRGEPDGDAPHRERERAARASVAEPEPDGRQPRRSRGAGASGRRGDRFVHRADPDGGVAALRERRPAGERGHRDLDDDHRHPERRRAGGPPGRGPGRVGQELGADR